MSPIMRDDERVVTIATCRTEFEASLARGALEAVGIPVFMPSEAHGSFAGLPGLYSGNPCWGAELRVFESDRERAMSELQRLDIDPPDPADDIP
jgi:hypothetical protein